MSEVTIITNDNRARNILIGLVTICCLSWWYLTGALPMLASAAMPADESGKLSSAYSIAADLIGDGLYAVGVIVASLASGLWSLVVSAIKMLLTWMGSKQAAAPDTTQIASKQEVDDKLRNILSQIEMHLNELDSRISEIALAQSVSTAGDQKPVPARSRRVKP